MNQQFEKLNPLLEAIQQLPQLRRVCIYLLDNGHAKKSGNPKIKPLPLFNKETGVESIDIGTGNSFLETGQISPAKATELMSWLDRYFAWVFMTEQEARDYEVSAWDSLITGSSRHSAFLKLKVLGDGEKHLIDVVSLKHDAYHELDKINVEAHWYLELSGEPGDNFFILLLDGEKEKSVQVAPLDSSTIDGTAGLRATILPRESSLRYPLTFDFKFDREKGVGYRRLVAIRSEVIPVLPKSLDEELTITKEQLNDLATRLISQNNPFHIDQYEFMLVDS